MRQSDDIFLELYNQYGTELQESQKADTRATYLLAMEKSGLKPPSHRRMMKVLLVAAVVATATLSVAAAYYSVSDAFRGVLSEPERPGGQTTASMAPVIDRSGTLIGEKAESGGIQVSLRAAVGDERNIKLLVDIVDTTGKPLAITQSDGNVSRGRIQFSDATLEMRNHPEGLQGERDEFGVFHGNVSGGCGDTLIDGNPGDNKATLLMDFSVADVPVRGENFRLHLQNLMQDATMSGASIGMEPGELYALVSGFGGHTDADFRNNGYSEDGDGNVTYSYELVGKSDKSVPLCAKTGGVQVTDAAVYKGILHLRGTASSPREAQAIMNQAALVNPETGDVKPWDSSGTGEEDGKHVWTMSFRGVNSPEEIKGFVWYTGYGEGLYPLAEGEWQFDFTLDYENTTRAKELNRAMQWQGHKLTAGKLEISPFSVYLELSTDADTMEILTPATEWGAYRPRSDWEKSGRPITITLKDGTEIIAEGPGGTSYTENGTGYIEQTYALDKVIDPNEVATVKLFDQVIELGAD